VLFVSFVVDIEPKNAMPTNILFTSVGRRVELLRSFRRAHRGLGLEGRIVAVDVDPLAPALQAADRPYIVPRLDSIEYIAKLADILDREQVNVVFPLIDPDIPVLAANRELLESTGARLAVVSSEAAETTSDKWQTYVFFRKHRLPVPATWLPGEIDPDAAGYPLFIKPRRGSASQHTFKVENARQLAFFSEYVPQPIVQEYLPGPEITNDVICDVDGRLLGVVSRERIRVRAGEVLVGRTVHYPEIAEACARLAAALPAVGPITVQCILQDGRPKFTEINARLGGGVPLGIAAGADSPRWLLAAAAGMTFDVPPPGSYRTGLYLNRFDYSHFATEEDRERMASHRI